MIGGGDGGRGRGREEGGEGRKRESVLMTLREICLTTSRTKEERMEGGMEVGVVVVGSEGWGKGGGLWKSPKTHD